VQRGNRRPILRAIAMGKRVRIVVAQHTRRVALPFTSVERELGVLRAKPQIETGRSNCLPRSVARRCDKPASRSARRHSASVGFIL
jgi:hypothetical protein